MSTRVLLDAVRARWRTCVALALVGLLVGLAHAVLTPRSYRATAEVFFALQYGNSAADLVQGSTYAQNQVASFARLATTPAVLGPVAERLELPPGVGLASRVTASAPTDTVIVAITGTADSPEESARLTNAVAESLSGVVEDLAPTDADGAPTVEATVVAPAEAPGSAAHPDPLLDLALGLALGLLLGVATAWGRHVLDNRVRDVRALADVTSAPLVGSVPVFPGTAERLFVARDPHGGPAEAVRQLRTNLQFLRLGGRSGAKGAQTLVVTSSMAGEGKSTVASNLAVALAETGASVLLVDADLRRPSVAGVLGLEGGVGLTTVLVGDASLEDVVQPWGEAGLEVLAAGPVPPNPTELLGSQEMTDLVTEARRRYDHVVVDAPPLLPVADAAVLAKVVDGAVVVARAGTVRRAQLAESLGNLERVRARVLGVVLNGVHRDEEPYRYEARSVAEPAPAEPVAVAAPVQSVARPPVQPVAKSPAPSVAKPVVPRPPGKPSGAPRR